MIDINAYIYIIEEDKYIWKVMFMKNLERLLKMD